MSVDSLRETGDSVSTNAITLGNWKCFKATDLVVAGIVPDADPSPDPQRATNVDAARQHSEVDRIIQSEGNESAVGHNSSINEAEKAMLLSFNRNDVAR